MIRRQRILIATTNAHKVREIRWVLRHAHVDVSSLQEMPAVAEPAETGRTFEENARQKVSYYSDAFAAVLWARLESDALVVAEDSGLVIDALDGDPGVYSARFVRTDATYPERFAEIERRLAGRPHRPRSARFICALAAARNRTIVFETTGTIEGEIAPAAGARGFGYDPIFYYPPYRRTLAQVSEEKKLRVAHRGRAFEALAAWLERSRDRA